MHDTAIWKNQRWFKKLSPQHKLAFLYIKDQCDHAGFWKVDYADLVDDLGIDEFDLVKFISACNMDFDKTNGSKIVRERLKLLENKKILWITGFMKFQYENTKDYTVNPMVPAVKSALELLSGHKTLGEALKKGYITLTEPYSKAIERTIDKDIDKDKDKDILNLIYSSDIPKASGNGRYFKDSAKKAEPIIIDGKTHMAKQNNGSYVYPTITGVELNKAKTKVKLLDGTWQELLPQEKKYAEANNLDLKFVYKRI